MSAAVAPLIPSIDCHQQQFHHHSKIITDSCDNKSLEIKLNSHTSDIGEAAGGFTSVQLADKQKKRRNNVEREADNMMQRRERYHPRSYVSL